MKKLFKIMAVIIVLILCFPLPHSFKDGGTTIYKAVLYEITNRHSMWTNEDGVDGYLRGIEIRIFGIEVYQNVKFSEERGYYY